MARLQVDDRRKQLLELGLTLFEEHSYESLSIDAIAAAAGVSKGLLYHYFPGKRAFYLAVVEAAAERLVDGIDSASERAEDTPVDSLRAAVDAFLDFAQAHRDSFRFLLRGSMSGDEKVRPIVDGVRDTFAKRLLEDGANMLAARGIIAFIESISLHWLDHPELPREDVRELAVRVAVAALAPTA